MFVCQGFCLDELLNHLQVNFLCKSLSLMLCILLVCRQEDMQGFIKEQDILTLGVKVWHVLEYDHFHMPKASYGQFHRGDTYVVRWQYMITNAGV